MRSQQRGDARDSNRKIFYVKRQIYSEKYFDLFVYCCLCKNFLVIEK